jgi:hypothetical protein
MRQRVWLLNYSSMCRNDSDTRRNGKSNELLTESASQYMLKRSDTLTEVSGTNHTRIRIRYVGLLNFISIFYEKKIIIIANH